MGTVQGRPIHKPPYSRLSAFDMNTGERLWWIPVGDAPQAARDHPALQDADRSRMGSGALSIQMVAGDLLSATEGSSGPAVLNAFDKRTGMQVGEVELPSPGQYGMMTYMHEGIQYIALTIGGDVPELIALALPE